MLRVADYWDVALWVVAGYFAVVTLVRLMRYQRDVLVARFRAQVALRRQHRSELAQRASQPGNVETHSGRHKPAA
jgi:hypothetical protein